MEDKIIAAVSDVLGHTVDKRTIFDDVSSLKMLQIIMALDEKGISVPLEKIAKIKSMEDIFTFAEEDV
ncbi:hypothetical protein [Cloacibacillus evryensis]|uniref:hypothetical protein n=1 Tax=Cloacibacillus evryensis TaxID=508460 RepID=UPI000240D94E|nr:hypothetical protein [Cloacibacillus evryensis]EHL68318.1 hypothetical protein HMPREF1006_02575 [Synergistes sp. 3_1_syn1]MCQ4764174.1 hypothetical protein [Cloacibacillus evryensis]